MSMFQKATRKKARLRMGLLGPAGSGKTFTALRMASVLAGAGRIAVIDTEHGSASLYVDEPNPDGGAFDFDVVDLSTWPKKFSVENYIRAIKMAGEAGYPILVVDSLSHAWAGEGGLLEFVDTVAARSTSKNSFNAWREATPLHNRLVDTLLSYPGHLIVTMRTKVEYVLVENDRGKKEPKKIGMQPVQRDGLDYEFTVVGDIDVEQNKLVVTKSRCSAIAGQVYPKAGAELARTLLAWLEQGTDAPAPAAEEPDAPATGHNGHHASFDAAERREFCAALGKLFPDLKDAYSAVAAFCEAQSMPRPSAMDKPTRIKLYQRLGADEGAGKFWDWWTAHRDAHPVKEPKPAEEGAQ